VMAMRATTMLMRMRLGFMVVMAEVAGDSGKKPMRESMFQSLQ
jgi:hypothetical protein